MTTQASNASPSSTPATDPAASAAAAATSAAATAAPTADSAAAGLLRETERLREQNRQLKAAQEERDRKDNEAKAAELAKNNQFKELADQHKATADAKEQELVALRAKQDSVYVDAELRARRYELLDPEDLALFDARSLKVKDGVVEGLDEKWAEFKKRKPHLFKPAGAASLGTPNGTHLGGPTPNSGEAPSPKNMTAEQWQAHLESQRKR